MDVQLSKYGGASTQPSPVNSMMAAFAGNFREGVDVNLGVGYVNERTIPAALIAEAMQAVASNRTKFRQAFNYGSPEGTGNLIASIKRFLARPGVSSLDPQLLARKRLIIGPCGATSILDSIAEILSPGIVITSDPMYYIYCDCLERKGFRVLSVPEDEEGLSVDILDRKLAELGEEVRAVSFFYVVTVNNPSGTILSNRRRRALYEMAADLSREQGRLIPIFFDLAYELLLHDPEAESFQSVLPEDSLGIAFEIGTLSKVLAPALRIGYLLGSDGPFMNAMVQKTSDAGFSAPPFVQEMAGYLLENHAEAQLRNVNAGYREKALAVRRGITGELGAFLSECRGGQAGFYFYLTFREVETHARSAFFKHLTRTTGNPAIDGPAGNPPPRVMYIPGEYCVNPRGDLAEAGKRQLRLSYGYEDAGPILVAIGVMRRAIESTSAKAAGR